MYKYTLCFPHSADGITVCIAQKLVVFGTRNPFTYGTIAVGSDFVGRGEELAKLHNLIKLGGSCVIRAPNGLGKSSLLAELANRHSKEFVFVPIDLSGITNEASLLELITRETMRAGYGGLHNFPPTAWELLKNPKLRQAVVENANSRSSEDSISRFVGYTAQATTNPGDQAEKPDTTTKIRMCPRCGFALKWLEKHSRFYCYNCKKYAPVRRTVKSRINKPRTSPVDEMRCPKCRGSLRFVHRYSAYYCEKCRRYRMTDSKRRSQERPTVEDVVEALDLPESIANQKATRVVVMLDEFQEIATIENPTILQTMRQRFDMHWNVSYLFAGSNRQILSQVFREKSAPFSDFAHWIELGPIQQSQLEKYLTMKFADAKGRLTKDVADLIVGLSGGYPYYAQKIAHELFHISPSPTVKQAEEAVNFVLKHQSPVYSVLWESIKSPLHRKYLLAAANEPRVAHGEEFVLKHDLRSRSHVQRTEKQLEMKGIISDGEIIDPMLVLWLRSMAHE
jgi:AAA+ ATPase superfamily predicted ATPase